MSQQPGGLAPLCLGRPLSAGGVTFTEVVSFTAVITRTLCMTFAPQPDTKTRVLFLCISIPLAYILAVQSPAGQRCRHIFGPAGQRALKVGCFGKIELGIEGGRPQLRAPLIPALPND